MDEEFDEIVDQKRVLAEQDLSDEYRNDAAVRA